MAVVGVRRRRQALAPADVGLTPATSVAEAMNATLAIVFALYVKTRNFQWHVNGSQFPHCHSILEQQGDQLYSMIKPIVERVRALGSSVNSTIGHLTYKRIVLDDDANRVQAMNMLAELREENKVLIASLRRALSACVLQADAAAAGLLETWIDESQRRALDHLEGSEAAHPSSDCP
jgi:starvation-inducible DNA-binding protein